MAAPVDAGRAAYGGASSNIHAVTMPATVSAGDTLLMVFRVHNGTVGTGPSGFTPLVNNDATDASDDATSIFYKKADGSEGGTTVNVTLAGGLSRKASAITWCITGAADPTVTPPEVSTVATGTSTTPDPGNLAPSGGSKDYLWFWIGAWEGEQTSPPTTPPASFSNWTGADTGTAGNTDTNNRCAGGSQQLTASSLDPASVTISASDDWSAWTVAVYPASASATGSASLPLTLSFGSAGKPKAYGASSLPLTFIFGSSGAAGGGAATGSASLPLTLSIGSAGTPKAYGAVSLSLALLLGSTGTPKAYGAASQAFTLSIGSSGRAGVHGSAAQSFTLSVSSSGKPTAYGAASVALLLGVGSSGKAKAYGSATLLLVLGVGSVGTVPVIRALHLTPTAEAALALAELGEAAGSPLLFVAPEGAESLVALAEQYYTFSGTPGLYPSPGTYPSAGTFPSPGAAVVTPGPRLSGRTEGALTLTPLPEA